MAPARVAVDLAPGLHIVRLDSTAPHNRRLLRGHGEIDAVDLFHVDAALSAAAPGALVVLLLHHHPFHYPEEMRAERLAGLIGWRAPDELRLGWDLLELARGRCDLVLHGHRHVPRAFRLWPDDHRPLGLYNAGSSTELGRARVFAHTGGVLLGGPRWLASEASPNLHRAGAAMPSAARTI
jgi:hypothetical protein